MMIETQIREQLIAAFKPCYLQVINQSHQHAAGAAESHFKVVVVSAYFKDQPRLKRHRAVYRVLERELASGVHALALHTYTEVEWATRSQPIHQSPACSGMRKIHSEPS